MYFACVMIMCTISVTTTVIVLNFHHRSPEMYEMPSWVSPPNSSPFIYNNNNWCCRSLFLTAYCKPTALPVTRWHIFELKCTKFDFVFTNPAGRSFPDPAGGAYRAPPDLAAFQRSTFEGDGRDRYKRAKGEERKGKGRTVGT